MYNEDLALKYQQWLIYYETKPNNKNLVYMYKQDLALNNLQCLISHRTEPNEIIYFIHMYKQDLA